MAIEVERLIASLEARIDRYEKNLAKARATTDKTFGAIESRGKRLQQSLDTTFSNFAKEFVKGFAFGAVGAVGLGVLSELPGTIRRIVGDAAGLVDVSQKLGLTTTAVQELHFAATQGGSSVEDMDKALGFFTKSVGEALDGTSELAKVLTANNIALRDTAGRVRDPLAILRDYANVIRDARSEQERARLTTLAFGKSGADLANVFRDGAGGIDAASAALAKMGGVLSDDLLQQIAAVDDRWDAFATNLETRVNRAILDTVAAMDDLAAGRSRVPGLSVPIPKNLQGNLPQNMTPEVRAAREELARYRNEAEKLMAPIEVIGSNPLNTSATGDTAREVMRLTEELKAGSISVSEFADGLDAVGKKQPSFAPMIASLKTVQREIFATVSELGRLTAQPETPVYPNRRAGIVQDRIVLAQRLAQGRAGLADASKGADLLASEKRLADEMDRLRRAVEKDRPGALVSEPQLRAQAQANIAAQDAAGAIGGYVNRTIGAESGGRVDAKNPNSSASGLGQFIESTWVDLFRRYFPDRARGMSDAAIAGLRTLASESDTTKTLIEAYAKENAVVLERAGVSVNEAALHLSHLLGAGDAVKVLKAAPGTLLKGLIKDKSIAANPTILGGGRTVEDAIAYAQSRAGQATYGGRQFGSNEDFAVYLKQQQATAAGMREELDLRRQLGAETIANTAAYAEYQRATELLAEAQQANAAVALEVHDVNTLLHGDLTKLSPAAREQAEAMRALAAQYGLTSEASAALDAGQEKVVGKIGSLNEIGRDALGTFISDLRQGKSAGEAFADVLDRIADRLVNIALDAVFPSGGGTGGGGILGMILGGLGGALGAPAAGGVYAEGGYTGPGSKYQIAGAVHAGEFVFDAASTRRIGPRNLEAMRRGRKGYADGGYVGPGDVAAAGRIASSATSGRGGTAITLAPSYQIDARGSQMSEAQLRAILRDNNKQLERHVERTVIPRYDANRWRTS